MWPLTFSHNIFFRRQEEVSIPLLPTPVNNPINTAETFSSRRVVFQYSASDHGVGISFFNRDLYYRRSFYHFNSPSVFRTTRGSCGPVENFDFNEGVIRNAAPTAPRQNPFHINLPDQTGWFEMRSDLCGHERGAIVYRPALTVAESKPLVIWLHGTGGSSGSVSHALFDENEARVVFGDQAVVLILEARSFMPEDWEHHGISHDHFWNTTDDHGDSNQDILYVEALIHAAIQQYAVDPQRVFLMGHSNGGFAAIHQGMALREQIRGIAVSSSGWVRYPYKHHVVSASNYCHDILLQGASVYMHPRNQFHWIDHFPYFDYSPIYDAPRPVSDFPQDHRPAVYQRLNRLDPEVPAFYGCDADRRMRERGYTELSTHVIDWINPDNPRDGYHFVDSQFMREAWDYLSSLPPRPITANR